MIKLWVFIKEGGYGVEVWKDDEVKDEFTVERIEIQGKILREMCKNFNKAEFWIDSIEKIKK